ncbi:hypothetical protein LSTR_LSTR004516 [Laodelphax striatellus]|uniref:Uncharacterized protein n=1 Tax=Laodelphax striatellus TaxID=195883 RepID=A0A482XHU6_LAOST|nr:hypothetical protein LSTR_LSTR004516 [Laodelphax striatellus]
MKKSAPFISSLVGEIKQDNVRGALEEVESGKEADFDARCATKCLIELQLLLCKGLNENKDVNSTTDDIFRLTKKCLDTIERSGWDIGNQQLLACAYYIIKFFLVKDKLSYGKYVCTTLHRWITHNSTQLGDSDRKILAQSICHTLTYYLHSIDLKKFLESSGNNLNLVFESCKMPSALQSSDETVMKKSLVSIRWLIHKVSSLNIEVADSIHIECVESVMATYLDAGNNVGDVGSLFISYLDVMDACVSYTASKKNYQELSKILKVIETTKKIFLHKDCALCLDYCKYLIRLILIDQGLVEGHFSNVCTQSCNSLVDLSSKNIELFPWAVVFLFKTFKSFPFEYKKHDSAFPNFPTLIVSACKIQKTIIDSAVPKTNELLAKLCAFVTLIPSKIINLPKELSNSEDFLVSMFGVLEKATDYSLGLLEYAHKNGCALKEMNGYALIERILFLINPYYSANMFDKAFKLAYSFIEKLVCLSCDSCCPPQINMKFLYKVASLCSRKTGKVGCLVDAILAAICKEWSKKSATVDANEMLEHLARTKNCDQCPEEDECSTFFELLDKRKTVLLKKWSVPESILNEIKCTSIVLSELKAYRKQLQTSQGDLVLKAFKSLLKLNPSIMYAAKGLVLVLDLSTRIHIDVGKLEKERLKIQENLRKQVKECNDYESFLLLGSLLHYSTLFKIYAVRKKIQVKTVTWKAQEAPQTLNETGMFSDPHESCGPIASSELAFTKQQPLLDELEKSYNYLKAALQKMEDDCNDLDTYLEIVYSNITLTAQLYTLYHFQEKACNTWKLLHSYGEKFSHQNMRLTAVTNLLKLEAQFDESWIDDAMQIAGSLSESASERQLFYISLASSCLKSSQISDAVSHLTKVGTIFRNEKINTNFLLILGQVLLIPESAALWNGTPSSSINAFDKAFRHLYHLINTNDWEGFIDHCFLEETFLDTLMCLKRYSSSIMMPRLTYYYLTEQSSIVQKLAVPLRVAELLISLAWVDVAVHKKDDCELKLANVIAILGLERQRHVIGAGGGQSPKQPKHRRALDAAAAQSSDGMMELMVTSQQVSPVFSSRSSQKYEWSQIVLHRAECACLSCGTPKFLQLTFDLLLLQAAAYCIRSQFSQAIKYFDDALAYLQFVRGRGVSDDWIAGRQTVFYYFYNEMLVSHKNYKAAALNISKMSKHPIHMEINGVTADLITLQKDNMMYINFKNRYKEKAKLSKALSSLAVDVNTVANEHTPMKTSLPSSSLLQVSSSKGTKLPVNEKRNLLVSAKTLDFSSSDEGDDADVVDSTFVDKENNFASPILAKQRVQRNRLPAFVAQVPKSATSVRDKSTKVAAREPQRTKMAPPAAKPLREKNEAKAKITGKPRGRFEICSDPAEGASSKAGAAAVVKNEKSKKTDSQKTDKPKRAVRAVRKV